MADSGTCAEALEFDIEALRRKYREERDKRLRSDGEQQYVELKGDFARYYETDPYVPPGFTRAPLTDEVHVAIIGGGFGGLLAAARLKQAGVSDIRIIEGGADFGGTWYWNRYPGAQCDIESYCYLPLLEELNYVPKEKYSHAPEIFEHTKHIGRAFGLYDVACFQTFVRELVWNEALKRWIIHTNHGDEMKARFVIVAVGSLNRGKLPGLPGLDTFKGRSFHTSRWDYDYTGGGPTGGLSKLADKRVGIIGTGSTGVQCIPHLGASAKHLYVFQRTPTAVGPRGNRPTDMEWVKTLKPGWHLERRKNFADIVAGLPVEEDLINDSWTALFKRGLRVRQADQRSPTAAMTPLDVEIADFRTMNGVRARVEEIVKDSAVAEKLKPWYRQFCKRPTFNDAYLETFNRPNVTLVDTSASKGVERLTEKGVVANGVEYEVDCLVFATGFETTSSFERRISFDVKGRGGRSLLEYWKNGFRTLHGHSAHGFPNWFFLGLGQNGNSANFTSMLDDQAKHLAYIISEATSRGAVTVETSLAAETQWVKTIHDLATDNSAFWEACTPGNYNNEGRIRRTISSEAYAPGVNAFNELLEAWREKGDMDGMVLGFEPGGRS